MKNLLIKHIFYVPYYEKYGKNQNAHLYQENREKITPGTYNSLQNLGEFLLNRRMYDFRLSHEDVWIDEKDT